MNALALLETLADPEVLKRLPEDKVIQLYERIQPRHNKYIPHKPTGKQAAFLWLQHKEAMYGGAAGGGKSDAILMAALQYVDVPEYAALILRKTYADLAKEGAIMDRAIKWLRPWVDSGEVHWNGTDKKFTFPSGATLSFGHLAHEDSKYNYQGAEYQFIGFDELTHFTETQYTYLRSRLRRLKGVRVPLRIRAASNPGGRGHQWVKQRFIIDGKAKNRPFIPAKLQDNPYLDQESYIEELSELDPTTRQYLLDGNWDAAVIGTIFKREYFKIIPYSEVPPAKELKIVRYWDLAATEVNPGNPDPDWTAGVKLALHPQTGKFYVLNVTRLRASSLQVEQKVKETAAKDSKAVAHVVEQEPGGSGKSVVNRYRTHILRGYACRANKPSEDKMTRAMAPSSAAENGDIHIVEGEWNSDFLLELTQFSDDPTQYPHDDQVDGFTGAYHELTKSSGKVARGVVKGRFNRPKV